MASVNGGLMAKKEEQAVAKAAPQKTMQALVKSMMPQIEKALPSVLSGERFGRMVLTALSSNKDLQLCTPNSFLGAMMQAAQLGVEPNTPLGQAYLIPYRNKGTLECQFQLGYKGLIDLAYRSGSVTDISAHEVYENDYFEYELGLEEKLRHKPALTDRGNVILYYAVYHTKDGGHGFAVMSVDDIRKHAKQYSKSSGSSYSPWTTNFDSMAKKTVLKQVLKYAPMKTEFVRGLATDGSIKTSIEKDMVDLPSETVYDEPENVTPTAEPANITVEAEVIEG